MAVYVLDKNHRPLMPCSEKRARKLLTAGRARVHRMRPFAIRLVDRAVDESTLQPIRLKIDPGSKSTGIALTRGDDARQWVLALIELKHRGHQIRDALTQRRAFRRRRRGNLRYRAKRFDNRAKPVGWLTPSLQHRVGTTLSWVRRLRGLAPITAIDLELVRFDSQLMQNPDISGVEYQQGTLAGYEVREYLLEKWGRQCIYCDATNLPLQIEHLHPKSDGGSNRPSNLGIACEPCNLAKGARPLAEFVRDPKRLARIEAQMRMPLRDAAAVNTTRWALYAELKAEELPVQTATGGRTKWNRSRLGIPKSHALDAACVGVMEDVAGWEQPTLLVACVGRGAYKRTRLDRHGFPRGILMRSKSARGFRTGDLIAASVSAGKKAGHYVGRVAIRATGSFNITTRHGVVQGISHKHCRLLQRADGYGYL